ncbi:glycine cleavage system aminomethyltransferase GcvT [Gordonia pseudamarae]|jgi:aminomethyltransferase|uniref:Aminomethyltransferase n=1 Tax=Gordonia pseudamarae TaxID=2831662 RepID=A0ABX6IIM3_9ACTN|nr:MULTISPECIES: glycine cleavage system aminomethyltransferase GcvT [Gordonia]MBD0022595.1 glycine cleavage system aminomethyltransferase GcvT [Gordonia sp. (in: high G+C Gram-positive bacteria)]QHN26842.1 glycine cleavage system aminomethyltransferase GcvT [Gordonia pseudamarae]QHN35733.1 glycine cleavage system aminomethyltransferase GcvT [Gordonia pseudamarae]
MSELLDGPIADRHIALGASFAEFGGWNMPVSYAGTVAEHTAVREAAGVFDVSHLGKALVAGPGAADFVNSTLTNDLGKIAPGKAQYTLCCTESGGVVDDLIAYLVGPDEVFLVPNAANTATVVEALRAVAPGSITITDQHREYAVFAVQGPRAPEVLENLGLPADMEYMAFADAELSLPAGAVPVRVCRTGYTGERGFEILPRWSDAGPVFDALAEQVGAVGGQPAGLGARDTLRTEMGYALHGHELSTAITPVQTRVGWAVGWDKPAFFGRDALLAEKAAGPSRRLYGLRATGRGIPREGCSVTAADGTPIGTCTSGTFSPTLKHGIALALLDTASGVRTGDEVAIDVRGRALACEVVIPPFVTSHV